MAGMRRENRSTTVERECERGVLVQHKRRDWCLGQWALDLFEGKEISGKLGRRRRCWRVVGGGVDWTAGLQLPKTRPA
ncbi:hypothetical protein SLA2020_474230 [Shorea laevis]